MKKGDKRGSHVGVIASFGIFIMFLVGIYFVVEPMLKIERDKQALLEYLEVELIEEFSDNLTKVVVSPNPPGDCLNISSPDIGYDGSYYATAKNDEGTILDVAYVSSLQEFKVEDSPDNTIWIYYSKTEFYNESQLSCGMVYLPPVINSITTTKEIFELKIIEDIDDFENLNTRLNIPPTSEFGFSFEMSNGTTLFANEKNVSGNVYVKDIQIQYIDYNATNLAGKLSIKVW